MQARSAKAKGQRAAKEVQSAILEHFPDLTTDDVTVTPSGVNGVDIHLSSKAKAEIPFAIEVKNQERLNIWEALNQAESHVTGQEIPVIAFRRNRSKVYVALEIKDFLKIFCKASSSHNSRQ